MKELRLMDRFVGLPFSVGCASQSSVAVMAKQTKRPADADAAASSPAPPSGEDGGRRSSIVKPRSVSFSRTALSFPRPNIAAGFQKLIRGFRSLSQLFLVDREEEGEDDDDEETEMVIGFPTDVQHVGHIGWDGFNGMAGGAMKAAASEYLQLPSSSFSLQQFELGGANPPPIAACPR